MAKSFEIKLSNEKIKPLLDKLKSWCDRGQLEPRNYEVLTKMITKCENYDDAISILEIATQSRMTGLFYRHQFEKIDTNKIHYLEEDKSMSFGNKGIVNKLIIGDNYLALENLLISYRGKIDVIYIDPPYGCNDMGEYADMNYENNISRDNLLSQLSPRLELAHQLLSNDGVIFCSIDDMNQAYVKCLLDDIFGEKNFLNTLDVINMYEGRHMNFNGQGCMTCKEYALIYAKNKSNVFWKIDWEFIKKNKLDERTYSLRQDEIFSDKISKYRKGSSLDNNSGLTNQYTHPNLIYEIYYNPTSHTVLFGNERLLSKTIPNNYLYKGEKNYFCLKNKIDNKTRIVPWRHEAQRIINHINDYIFECDKNSLQLKNIYIKDRELNKTWIKDFVIKKNSGSAELKCILGRNNWFSNPKSVWFIKYLISFFQKNDLLILDFYAGSGTTGHAVLDMNKMDGGNRKFILCTNEDKLKGKLPHGIGTDVTYERLKRIMTGKSSDNSNFQWIKENDAYGQILKVYKIAEMENFKKEIFELINPLDYDYKCLSEKKKIEWICKNFEQTQKILEEKK